MRSASKLNRLLQSYEPDSVQLHGVFSKHPRLEEYTFSLNLSLPTGTLHATGTGENIRARRRLAFSELQTQVKKHQSRLRKDYEWKRKRRARPSPRSHSVRQLLSKKPKLLYLKDLSKFVLQFCLSGDD